jgi:hypothetical protein
MCSKVQFNSVDRLMNARYKNIRHVILTGREEKAMRVNFRQLNSRRWVLAGAVAAGGLAIAFPGASRAALLSNVVFNDTLSTNGSTLGSASQSYSNTATPTATSTNYDIAASKEATSSSLNSGGPPSGTPLELMMVSTSSGINEAQGLFTSTPVQLTTVGQSVEITVTFNNTAGLNQNSSSAVYLGLYSSGGSAPYNNMENGSSVNNAPGPGQTGLANSPETVSDDSGGVKGWVGYESDYFGGSSTKEYSRPAQATSTNNADQGLVGDGQTGGPSGTQASYTQQNSHESTLTTTSGSNTYTDEFEITLSAVGTYTLTEAMYVGASDTGSLQGTAGADATIGTSTVISNDGFDGFAIGYRESDSEASEMDITNVEVTTNVTVPEPASLGALAVSSLLLGMRRRRQI